MAKESCSPRSASEAPVEGGGWAQYLENTAAQGVSDHLLHGKGLLLQISHHANNQSCSERFHPT